MYMFVCYKKGSVTFDPNSAKFTQKIDDCGGWVINFIRPKTVLGPCKKLHLFTGLHVGPVCGTDDSDYFHISATMLTVVKWHICKVAHFFLSHKSNNGHIKTRNFTIVIIICNILVD